MNGIIKHITFEETLDKLQGAVEELADRLDKKPIIKQSNPEDFKKNSHLHIFLETSLHEKLKKEAKEKCISVSELARKKLRENDPQLDRIEKKIDKIAKPFYTIHNPSFKEG